MKTSAPLCLITGANAGIGHATAIGLARAGHRLVLACRDPIKGETARRDIIETTGNTEVELLVVDLASQASIHSAAEEFLKKYSALDVLVNNAGIASLQRRASPDGVELTFATNVLGYHLLTQRLLGALQSAPKARVINVASGMAYGLDLADVEFKHRKYDASDAYAQSKQADRMLTWAWARRLAGTRITANAMTPGAVRTKLLQTLAPGFAGRTTEQGADTIVWLATNPDLDGVSGKFWADRRERPCPFRGVDGEEALWSLCEAMTSRGNA